MAKRGFPYLTPEGIFSIDSSKSQFTPAFPFRPFTVQFGMDHGQEGIFPFLLKK